MKRFMPMMFVPFIAVAACGDDATTTPDGSDATSADTNRPDGEVAAETTPGVSALTGVNTNVSGITEPTRADGCDDSKVVPPGARPAYPWGGLDVAGTALTCNGCPGGVEFFQGTWRAHGFAADEVTPDYDLGADADNDDAEVIIVDGNTFYSHLSDQQSKQSVETRGWIACSQKPEHPNEHWFWTTLSADPVGALEANVGDINRSNIPLEAGPNGRLIEWFWELSGPNYTQIGYCKVGTSLNGQVCNNPFD